MSGEPFVEAPPSLDSVVSQWAHRTPHAIAVIADNASLTYRQLEHRSNQLAHHLIRAGVIPGAAVGLLMPRSAGYIVSALAALKIGAHYVPLSAELPARRTHMMIQDNQVRVALIHRSIIGPDRLPVERHIALDTDQPRIDRESPAPVCFPADPDRTAYVMYTSGTTGRPKGVAIAHRGVLGLGNPTYLDFQPGDRFLLHSSLLFDASTFELWVPLLNGATVIVAHTGELSLARLAATITRHKVTTAFFTTSLFHQLVRLRINALGHMRNLLFGGEVTSPTLLRQAATQWPRPRLIHCYGPTECTTFTTCHTVTTALEEPVPLGQPITGRYIRILTDDLQLTPRGTTGELCVGGTCLARGYVNQPEATAAAFVPDPFSAQPGATLYRTGDLVVQSPDGNLLFQGRKDSQLKIRGFRIEPTEVEQTLRLHPQINDAVVVKAAPRPSDERLVAYVVHPRHEHPNPTELRSFLSEFLPTFMIPSIFKTIDHIPLNSSGKTDREALSKLSTRETDKQAELTHQSGQLAEELIEIWRSALGVETVSADADFFLLGGHSLQILEIIETLSRTYGIELPVEEFLENPTITALHAKISARLRLLR